MNRDSNMARQIRAMVETLGEWADEYDGTGQLEERDQILEVREQVGALHALPDPDDEDDDV
jgi:hypothetical protein